jgi:hypothetical protein
MSPAVTRRPIKITGTLDIECADWDVFCIGATFDGIRPRIHKDPNEMLDYLREIGGTHWAHAGGVYDLLMILELARVRGIPCQVDRAQHRVTRIVMGSLELRDSYSLWPAPLDDLCGAIGEPVPKLPWPCVCKVGSPERSGSEEKRRDGCGGYCQIMLRALEGDPDLEDYVKADARVLYRALERISEWSAEHKIAIRGTMGQTAWISAQDELGVPDSEIPYHLWRHARQADKGGRIAVVRPRSLSGVVGAHHDICSAYPAQLAHAELPVGGCRELGGPGAKFALERCRPGIYTVSVTVPSDSFLPPLPWHKAGQLCFPTGEFTGSWVLPELIAAFERGTELRDVHSALVWESTAPLFAPLVERWYKIRKDSGRKTPIGQWMGRAAKALTGKFAERPDRERVVFHPDEIKICTRQGQCRKKCTKRCGAYEQIDTLGFIWAVPYHRMSPSAYPQWSSYLRAMTRVQWLSQAERMGEIRSCGSCGVELDVGATCALHPDATPSLSGGGRAICMGNTDSLWHTSRQAPEPLGDDLGQWEYQHAWTDLEVRAPSVYAFRDPGAKDPRELQVHGIPGITEDDWRRGRGAIDRGIVTLGNAMRSSKGLFNKRHREWSLPQRDRAWYGDRKLGSDGLTYPASADELRELGRAVEARKKSRDAIEEIVWERPASILAERESRLSMAATQHAADLAADLATKRSRPRAK